MVKGSWCAEGAFWRKNVTVWLQDEVKYDTRRAAQREAEERMVKGRPHMEALLHLTGNQVREATKVVALQARDARLATLLAQGGGHLATRALLTKQLQIWSKWAVDDYVLKDRMLLYQLLAGQVDEVVHELDPQLLDWRRAFGLYLWFRMPSSAPLADVLRVFESAHLREIAPAPTPYYEEARRGPDRRFLPAARDLTYHLLCLASRQPSELAPAQHMFLPATYSADPLDHAVGWHLQGVLRAIGADPWAEMEVVEGEGLQAHLHCNFSAQLEMAGGLCEWAVYAAMHLAAGGARTKLVSELLHQHCDEWSGDPDKAAFLRDTLGVPPEMLSDALAQRARYRRDWTAELAHRLDAGQWATAHRLFVRRIAPTLFLQGKHAEVRQGAAVFVDAQDEVDHWRSGAHLFLEYYSLHELSRTFADDDVDPHSEGDDANQALEIARWRAVVERCRALTMDLSAASALWCKPKPAGLEDNNLQERMFVSDPHVAFTRMVAAVSVWQVKAAGKLCTPQVASTPSALLLEDARACRVHSMASQMSAWLQTATSQTTPSFVM
mmetsp:Transcript_49038/g.91316  ORF Transcript_49038/g.91316 Transcript_49038/m.91316 type:complete len:553 (+) Transcript_49038:3-1661(+)